MHNRSVKLFRTAFSVQGAACPSRHKFVDPAFNSSILTVANSYGRSPSVAFILELTSRAVSAVAQ